MFWASGVFRVIQVSDWSWGSGGYDMSGYLSHSDRPLPTAAGDKQPKKQEKKPVMVPPEFVDEALCACQEHLSTLSHLDIDKDLEAPLYLSPEGWSLFLQHYYQVVQ